MEDTLEISLGLLKPEERQALAELAIFPEDAEIPLATLAYLWQLDDLDTEDRAKKLARQCLEEARRSLWNLRPTPLEGLSLFQALSQEVARLNDDDGLHVDLALLGEEQRLPPQIELNLFRFAQEALTNVRRHAQARTALGHARRAHGARREGSARRTRRSGRH